MVFFEFDMTARAGARGNASRAAQWWMKSLAGLSTVCLAMCAEAGISASPNPSTGDYTISWTQPSVGWPISRYILKESTNGGASWTDQYMGTGYSKGFSGRDPGTYTYDLYVCFLVSFGGPPVEQCIWASNMSGWSTVDAVVSGPEQPTGLSGPTSDFDGTFTLSWNPSSGSTSYTLQEYHGISTWSTVYSGSATSKLLPGRSNGTYYYRVKGCVGSTCSLPSAGHSVVVEELSGLHAPPPIVSASATGSTPFETFVSRLGNANIRIPIRAPIGVNGLAPDIGIYYSSGAPQALLDDNTPASSLGYGWRLDGVPEIRRCRVGVGGEVSHTSSDQLCLNGLRLIRVAGSSYWANNAEYRTEAQTFVKVRAMGSSVANRYFHVFYPDGGRAVFGDDASARVNAPSEAVPYRWSITERRDDFDNVMSFTWGESTFTGTNYLLEISYDGSTIAFRYNERCVNQANCDVDEVQFDEDIIGVSEIALVLNRILTTADGKWVTDYRLDSNYTGGKLKLEAVQQCGYNESGTTSKCLPPLDIDWQTLSTTNPTFETVVREITNGYGDKTRFEHRIINGTGSSNHPYHINSPGWFGSYTQPPGIAKHSNQRAIVWYMCEPNGRGGQTLTYFRYNGYPLYSTEGRGYLGFPSVRKIVLYTRLYDDDSDSTFDSRHVIDIQHRLDFPFIGKQARRIHYFDIDSSSAYVWRIPERYEFGWESKPMFSGTVQFPHLARFVRSHLRAQRERGAPLDEID